MLKLPSKPLSITATILVATLYLQTSYPIYAQDATKSSGTRNIQQRIQEKLASRAAMLKEKLARFKDQKKAEIAERVDDNLNKINERRTQMMMQKLDTMSNIVNKLDGVVITASAAGKDTASASAAIATARQQIASASTAVSTQKTKDYTVTVSTESRLKADVKKMRDQLHKDLSTAHTLVVIARKSVSDAISTTRSSLGGAKR